MTREELIAALERATGADAELGREVLLASGWRKTCVGHFYGPFYRWSGPNGEYFHDDDFARHDPTRSLDAALSLVPASCLNDIGCELGLGDWSKRNAARFGFPQCEWILADGDLNNPKTRQFIGRHNGPALALCIASLRARAGG